MSRKIPKRQRMAPRTWAQCLADCDGDRDVALHTAYRHHDLTMTALAQAAGLSVSRVSRVLAAIEARAPQDHSAQSLKFLRALSIEVRKQSPLWVLLQGQMSP